MRIFGQANREDQSRFNMVLRMWEFLYIRNAAGWGRRREGCSVVLYDLLKDGRRQFGLTGSDLLTATK